MMTRIHAVIREIADDDRKHDPWGAGMTALGAVCDVLFALGEAAPDSAGYSPSILQCADVETFRCDDLTGENWHQHAILAALDPEFDPGYYVPEFVYDLTVEDLQYAANVLSRYLDLVKLAGEDY